MGTSSSDFASPSRSCSPSPRYSRPTARRRFLVSAGVGAGVLFAGFALPGAALLPAFLTSGGVARASIMVALDLPTLVQEADHIAVVEVGEIKAAWDERHERIYSTIDLKVVEKMKTPAGGSDAAAAAGDHLTVVQPGGTVGDIRMTVTGMGTFVPGERSLVFLRGPANHAQVVGMTQGKRPMRYENGAGRWVVTPPDLRQAQLVRPPATKPLIGQSTIQTRPPAASTPATPASRVAPAGPSSSAPSLRSSPPSSAAPSMVVAPAATRELPLDDLRSEIKQLLGARRP